MYSFLIYPTINVYNSNLFCLFLDYYPVVQRPRGPPPPTPSTIGSLTNGQSTENVLPHSSSVDLSHVPTPSPRKVYSRRIVIKTK